MQKINLILKFILVIFLIFKFSSTKPQTPTSRSEKKETNDNKIKDTNIKEKSIKDTIIKEKTYEQKLLENLDKFYNHSDGLYKGEVIVSFPRSKKFKNDILVTQKNSNTKIYQFHLYILSKFRMYYFFDKGNRILLKILFHYHPESQYTIYVWEPLKQKLMIKKNLDLFDKILSSNLNYLDLFLLPLSKNFKVKEENSDFTKSAGNKENGGINKSAGNKENTDFKKPAGIKENANLNKSAGIKENAGNIENGGINKSAGNKENSDFTKNSEFSKIELSLITFPYNSPFSKIILLYNIKNNNFLRLDFFSFSGFLEKSYYPKYNFTIYNEEKKLEETNNNINKVQINDFINESLTFFEIQKFEPREATKLKENFFNPNYLY